MTGVEKALLIKNFAFDASMAANGFADLNGVVSEANTAFLRLWGYADKDEVVGKTIPDFFDDPQEAQGILVALRGTGRWEGDFTARRKDGSIFPASCLATDVWDDNGKVIGFQGTMMDITDRKRLEQTLREWNQTLERRVAERTTELQMSEARLTQLAEATFEGLVISEGGFVMDGNAQLQKLLGYELSEMIGRPVADFVAPESRSIVSKHIRNGYESPYEFNGLRKDGSVFPAEAHASMRIWQGKRIRVTAVRDLTTVKREAARSLAQQAELEQSRRLALVSEISAGIVHQIGQPLSAIAANIGAALAILKASGTQATDLVELLQDVEASLARMRETTTHLRALAHPEHPTRMKVDLNDLVAGVLKLEWHDVVSRQVRFVTDFAPDLPPLLADAVQLSHVVCILRRNAIEACAECPPERQTVTVSTRRLDGEGMELCVRDAGPGIPHAVMPNLFTPFFTTKATGLGVGLRLCQTIVEAHGGRIEAANNPDGIGARFRVVLPELAE